MYNQYKEAQTLMVNNYNKINKMSNHLSSQAIEHKTDHNILLFLWFFFYAFISAQNRTIAG